MKLKKVANKAKVEKENQEKLSKFYHQIAQGEATTLPDLETEDILEAKSTNYDRNLLHLAVWYHQNDIVTQICENKELKDLINEQDNNGDTPLHLAVFTKNLEAYRTLLLSGGDATIPNNQDELPLEVILDNKEWEDFSQRLATMTASMPPDIKLTLIPDNSNILGLPSPNGSSRRDSSRMRLTDFTVHSPSGDSQSRHLKTSLNEPKNRFNETTVLPRTLSIAEDLVDSDQENPKDMLNIVRSKAFKEPKTLSQVHEGSLKEPSYVISICKSSPTAQQNKKYGSSLLTKISSETFYLVNKISPRPVSDDWPRNEDIGF